MYYNSLLGTNIVHVLAMYGSYDFKLLDCNAAITSHVSACITLALFIVNEWSCDDYWYIFGFCRYIITCTYTVEPLNNGHIGTDPLAISEFV